MCTMLCEQPHLKDGPQAKADIKHVKEFAIMGGISGINAGAEHVAEHYGAQWFGQVISPLAEFLHLYDFAVENVRIDAEVEEQISELKKKLRCR